MTFTSFLKSLPPRPKPKSSIPTMKRMTKAVEGMGKAIAGYEMRPDGSVRVLVADTIAPAADANPWDEVLTHGPS